MSDPCASQRAKVTQVAQKVNALEGEVGPHGIPQAKLKQAEAQLAAARTQLAACQEAHADTYVGVSGPAADPVLVPFDRAMQRFMVRQEVRAGQLSILNKGWLVLSHGYTHADGSYPKTKPSSLFRIASISKMFTCAAIQRLYDEGAVHKTDSIFPLLGITSPALATQKADPHVKAITVQQVVDHQGGWNDGTDQDPAVPSSGFDPVFRIRKIALDLGLHGPPTKRDLARYMYGEPLQFAPGTSTAYSNFGYVLLGLVVEEVSGRPFIDYVRDELAVPAGIKNVCLARMLAGPLHRREVSYDDVGTGANALEPHASVNAAKPYGGNGFVTELMDSGGGLMATSTALASFAHLHAAYGLGGRKDSARSGGMSGTMSLVETRGDVDFAYIFNKAGSQAVADAFYGELNGLFESIKLPEPQFHIAPTHA